MRTMKTSAIVLGGIAVLAISTSVLAIPEGPEPGTPEWTQREAENFAKTSEAPNEQAQKPEFQNRWLTQSGSNRQDWIDRAVADPSWVGPPSGNSPNTPAGAMWSSVATGDPTRYPDAEGPNGGAFYENEGEVASVVFYDAGCARITAYVWAPRTWTSGAPTLPGAVVQNGSIQATQPLYWWAAQALVRAGYVVMTFDPRGQGRSDLQTPDGEQGGNVNSDVFFSGMVNAIDFFRSSPANPYPHNATCAGTYPTVVNDYNPFHERLDLSRLGIAGHSLGASGVSAVQGYPGDRFEHPDPDGGNPVDVVIGWDSLGVSADGPPRVPAMGQSGEYGLAPQPFRNPPDPESKKGAYHAYHDAGIPIFVLTVQGSTHYEWSLLPTFPATSWCPDMSTGSCLGGWGNPMATHYTVAWMDRWLKLPGEAGHDDADTRLLADGDWCERYSFYFRSARSFPDRSGTVHTSEDIRADCLGLPTPTPTATSTATGPTPTSAVPTPTPTTTPEALCGAAPATGCRQSTVAGKGRLHMRDRSPDTRDRLVWKWVKGEATSKGDFGAPLASTDYAFCLYDGTASLVSSAEAPADGVCDGKPCWRETPRGFKYRQRGTPTKLQMLLKSGEAGKASIIVKGAGGVPPIPRLPIAMPVTVQLVNDAGTCWEARFSSPSSTNQPDEFKGRSD
jgi:hypothetical protein